jgi:hypothetical protein
MSFNPGKLVGWFTIWNDFKTQLEFLEMKVFMENLLQMAINTEDIMVFESGPILLYKTQLKTSKINLLFQLKSLVQSFGVDIFRDLSWTKDLSIRK